MLHVIAGLADRYGGPSRFVTTTAAALSRSGCDVLIASTDADGDRRLNVPIGTETQYAGVPAIFFPRRGGDGFKYSPELARWLAVAVGRFDVVHIHAVFSHSSIAAARACWRARVPYVLRPLGSLAPWALDQKRWQKRVLLQLACRRMISRAARVQYTTDAERLETEVTFGPTHAAVVPAGLDDEWFDVDVSGETGREPVVLALSRLHPVKNIETAIAAFHAAAVRSPDWTFVIAGDGDNDYRLTLEQAASDGPAAGRIRFVGWVDRDQTRDWLKRASVFVQASHQESFGIATLEAMAAGLPPVVTPGVALSEDIRATGAGWCAGPDQASLSAALHRAMSDADERLLRGAAARRLASRFTGRAAASQLLATYKDVVLHTRVPAGIDQAS